MSRNCPECGESVERFTKSIGAWRSCPICHATFHRKALSSEEGDR